MLKVIIGRYALFGVVAIESLALPYFVSKDMYGEVEFYKYTAFLAQFGLLGAGTGYIVRYMKSNIPDLTIVFIRGAVLQAIIVGLVAGALAGSWAVAILSVSTILAMVFESTLKVREKYLLAMSFKPLLSVMMISLLPFLLLFDWQIENYVMVAFTLAFTVYFFIVKQTQMLSEFDIYALSPFKESIFRYFKNIRHGFVMNASTAMMFIFFYIDRGIVREKFPELLGDYSLSYSIMQLTIVAITAFSYVNLIGFGKEKVEGPLFKKKMYLGLKKCWLLYLLIGFCSITFSYWAERFYGPEYEQVFETTVVMVVLFGLANVLGSLNAAHLYLGSVNIMSLMMLFTVTVSISLNWFISFSSVEDYYILLVKTYGLYLLFSVFSCSYICFKLRNITTEPQS